MGDHFDDHFNARDRCTGALFRLFVIHILVPFFCWTFYIPFISVIHLFTQFCERVRCAQSQNAQMPTNATSFSLHRPIKNQRKNFDR